MCSSAPDTSGMNQAAVQSAALSKEALDWFKTQYAAEAPQRQQAVDLATGVAKAQIGGMDFATQQAKDAATRLKTVQQPLEDKIIASAQSYDTPERRAAEAERAAATVESAAGRAQTGMTQDIMRRGGDLSSGNSAALMADAALKKAAMTSKATGDATRGVEQQGYARTMDAASLLKGLPSTQATQQQIATNAGGAAVGASNAGLAATTSGDDLMTKGFSTGQAGLNTAGSIYGQIANVNQQNSASNNSMLAGLGSAAGMYFGMAAM